MKIKKGIPENLREPIMTWAYSYFKNIISKGEFNFIVKKQTNWDISAMLVDDEDSENVWGVYLLGNDQLPSEIYVNDHEVDKLEGVECVLLVIDESIRGLGYGNNLKVFPKSLNVDYVWGEQLKDLNNLEDWLKRRILVYENEFVYITAEFFN